MKQSTSRLHSLFPVRGFTLIEVLITITIMGVLSTIGISTFQTTQKKSRDLNRKTSLSTVAKALENYMTDKGIYPPSSSDGKILWCGTADAPQTTPCSWGEPFTDPASSEEETTVYLTALPKDIAKSQTYFYEGVDMGGAVKGYRLYGRLENEKDPERIQYSANCSSDPSSTLYCNYALTSETVPLPTPYIPIVTSTPTLTYTPTQSPTPTVGCLAIGTLCSTGSQCCSGQCVKLDMWNPFGNCCYSNGHSCVADWECCSVRCDPSTKTCVPFSITPTPTPSCIANGTSCSSSASCCSAACGTDADNDGYFRSGQSGTCHAHAHPYTDCNDANASLYQNLSCYTDADSDTYTVGSAASTCCGSACGTGCTGKRATSSGTDCYDGNYNAKPGSTYCGILNRGDGSFDYNCSGTESYCGTSYYGTTTDCADGCHTWENQSGAQRCTATYSTTVNLGSQAACGQIGYTRGSNLTKWNCNGVACTIASGHCFALGDSGQQGCQ